MPASYFISLALTHLGPKPRFWLGCLIPELFRGPSTLDDVGFFIFLISFLAKANSIGGRLSQSND
jgi:hypothetical protein